MRARSNVYHLECFACQECGHRFCVGDQFFLHDNKVMMMIIVIVTIDNDSDNNNYKDPVRA